MRKFHLRKTNRWTVQSRLVSILYVVNAGLGADGGLAPGTWPVTLIEAVTLAEPLTCMLACSVAWIVFCPALGLGGCFEGWFVYYAAAGRLSDEVPSADNRWSIRWPGGHLPGRLAGVGQQAGQAGRGLSRVVCLVFWAIAGHSCTVFTCF